MTEFARSSEGLSIAFDVVGKGKPIVLVHGFASSRAQNWKDTGWYDTLADAGYRVIALDCRGHGESDKPYDSALYAHESMAGDVRAVMEDLGVSSADVMGYSMGGFISIHLLMETPQFTRKIVIGGVGETYLDEGTTPPLDRMADPKYRAEIADALLAPDKSKIANPTARAFREFAEQSGKDRQALAACMRAARRTFTRTELSYSTRPVLVVCGEKDVQTGRPDPLAAAFADGRAIVVPGRDHMTAVGDKVYKQAVLDFLKV